MDVEKMYRHRKVFRTVDTSVGGSGERDGDGEPGIARVSGNGCLVGMCRLITYVHIFLSFFFF